MVVVDWKLAKLPNHGGSRAASIAVHRNGLICLADVRQVGAVGKLADCALVVKEKVVVVDHAMRVGRLGQDIFIAVFL